MEWHDPDLIQRCLCGLHRYLCRRVEGLTVMTAAVAPQEARLPARDTKIHRCLMAVVDGWPRSLLTQDIATASNLSGKETSALLAVLAARGLVERLEERRGLIGGSVWVLTRSTAQMLRLEKE
jgi:hypothetical protein